MIPIIKVLVIFSQNISLKEYLNIKKQTIFSAFIADVNGNKSLDESKLIDSLQLSAWHSDEPLKKAMGFIELKRGDNH